jgi:hypothetical protein
VVVARWGFLRRPRHPTTGALAPGGCLTTFENAHRQPLALPHLHGAREHRRAARPRRPHERAGGPSVVVSQTRGAFYRSQVPGRGVGVRCSRRR